MTMTPFTCDLFAGHLADYLEHDADESTRAAMDAHAAGCDECRALLVDIAALRDDAAALQVLEPSRDLWSGIAARIETPVVSIGSGAGSRGSGAAAVGGRRSVVGVTASPAKRRWWTHPALIAAGLVGITAGVTHYATRAAFDDARGAGTVGTAVVRANGATVNAPAQVADAGKPIGQEPTGVGSIADRRPPTADRSPVRTVSAPDSRLASPDAFRQGDLAALDSLYYREILRLRRVLGERHSQLDSTTVAVIERNMDVIDRAIAECRAALAADPASRFLNQQLNEALESKIELLRTAATMPVRS